MDEKTDELRRYIVTPLQTTRGSAWWWTPAGQAHSSRPSSMTCA